MKNPPGNIDDWREVLGWIVIIMFSYTYLFEVNTWELLAGRRMAFPFLVAVTFFVLAWLWLNREKHEH